jgi:formylglycine-generating enzyme required for sulfatase activity
MRTEQIPLDATIERPERLRGRAIQIYALLGLAVLAWTPLAANPEMTVDLPGGATMDFVWIGPGTFTMGTPRDGGGSCGYDCPQHEVTLSQGFWLGKHEVTQR